MMSEKRKNLYAVLGVLPDAEDVVIRAAYRALVARYHPDRYRGDPDEAKRRSQEINDAYAILSDLARRKQHDDELDEMTGMFDGARQNDIDAAYEDASNEL